MNYRVTITTTTPETLVFDIDAKDAVSASLIVIKEHNVNESIINSCVAVPV